MRILRLILPSIVLLNCGLSFIASAAAPELPLLPLVRAVALAQEQLDIRGLEKTVFIESVVLEKSSAMSRSRHWTIRWSQAIPSDSGRSETGAEVDMEGHVVRLVKNAGAAVYVKPGQ